MPQIVLCQTNDNDYYSSQLAGYSKEGKFIPHLEIYRVSTQHYLAAYDDDGDMQG